MAKAVRETILRLSGMLRFKLKVVENAKRSLGGMPSNKNPWAGQVCWWRNCIPYKTEKVEPCMQQNVLLESRCTLCNGGEKGTTTIVMKTPTCLSIGWEPINVNQDLNMCPVLSGETSW